MKFPESAKRPIDRAMHLVEEAGKKDCKAFLAPADKSMLPKEEKGPHVKIQTRLVVVGLEDEPVEVLFLHNNNDRVLNRLNTLKVPVSLNHLECKEARIVALKVVELASATVWRRP